MKEIYRTELIHDYLTEVKEFEDVEVTSINESYNNLSADLTPLISVNFNYAGFNGHEEYNIYHEEYNIYLLDLIAFAYHKANTARQYQALL